MQIINPPGVSKPQGYSHAVKKSGTPVFLAGQVALDAAGKLVGEGDVAAQVEQVFQNLRAVVTACGGTMNDIVKLTIYVTDVSHRGTGPTWDTKTKARKNVVAGKLFTTAKGADRERTTFRLRRCVGQQCATT